MSTARVKITVVYNSIIENDISEDIVNEKLDLDEWVDEDSKSLFAERNDRKQVSE